MPRVSEMKPLQPCSARAVAVDAFNGMSEEEQQFLQELAAETRLLLAEGKNREAWLKCSHMLDMDEQLALWSLFASHERSALKRACNEIRS